MRYSFAYSIGALCLVVPLSVVNAISSSTNHPSCNCPSASTSHGKQEIINWKAGHHKQSTANRAGLDQQKSQTHYGAALFRRTGAISPLPEGAVPPAVLPTRQVTLCNMMCPPLSNPDGVQATECAAFICCPYASMGPGFVPESKCLVAREVCCCPLRSTRNVVLNAAVTAPACCCRYCCCYPCRKHELQDLRQDLRQGYQPVHERFGRNVRHVTDSGGFVNALFPHHNAMDRN